MAAPLILDLTDISILLHSNKCKCQHFFLKIVNAFTGGYRP